MTQSTRSMCKIFQHIAARYLQYLAVCLCFDTVGQESHRGNRGWWFDLQRKEFAEGKFQCCVVVFLRLAITSANLKQIYEFLELHVLYTNQKCWIIAKCLLFTIVMMSVSVHEHISATTCTSSPVACGHGSILLWCRCSCRLCTSGLVDDVTF